MLSLESILFLQHPFYLLDSFRKYTRKGDQIATQKIINSFYLIPMYYGSQSKSKKEKFTSITKFGAIDTQRLEHQSRNICNIKNNNNNNNKITK